MPSIAIALFILWIFQFIFAATYEEDRSEEDTYVKLNLQKDENLITSFTDLCGERVL
jgi:hypothetical protein